MRIETPCQGFGDESRADAVFCPSVRQTETSGRPEIRSSGGQSRLGLPSRPCVLNEEISSCPQSVRWSDEAVWVFLHRLVERKDRPGLSEICSLVRLFRWRLLFLTPFEFGPRRSLCFLERSVAGLDDGQVG
jgi:hypothetical protein